MTSVELVFTNIQMAIRPNSNTHSFLLLTSVNSKLVARFNRIDESFGLQLFAFSSTMYCSTGACSLFIFHSWYRARQNPLFVRPSAGLLSDLMRPMFAMSRLSNPSLIAAMSTISRFSVVCCLRVITSNRDFESVIINSGIS
jgi:hypothetical protein